MNNMIRKAHYLTSHQVKLLTAEHKKTGLKPSEILRRALDAYFHQQSQK